MGDFFSSSFMPHGHCYLWTPGILWPHAIGDALIALSYFSIPFGIVYFIRRREDLAFSWIYVLFAIFILACGLGHLIDLWNIWNGAYGISAVARGVTAIASVATAIALWPLIPKALEIPSHGMLRAQIAEKQEIENQLREANELLEVRVRERTSELEAQRRAALETAEQARIAQAIAEERQAHFQAVVASFPAGLLAINKNGEVRLVNEALLHMFGYTREELVGQPVEIFVPEEIRSQHREYLSSFLRAPRARAMSAGTDLYGRRKDNSKFPVEIGLRPIDGGGDIAVLASVVDISSRKRVELELRRSNEELEQFAYVASHDLQEPLRMVSSFAELLGDRYKNSFDEKGELWLGYLIEGAGRMRELVNDLLEYSRAGNYELNTSPIDTKALVEDVLLSLRHVVEEKKARLTVGNLDECTGDQRVVRLVFQNLISNALKFQPQGTIPEILIESVGGRSLPTFVVRDNGIGIDPEFKDNIFVIFQRHNGRDYEGTGLGLAICKKIVERHNGQIWVDSELGKGASFYFTLGS